MGAGYISDHHRFHCLPFVYIDNLFNLQTSKFKITAVIAVWNIKNSNFRNK